MRRTFFTPAEWCLMAAIGTLLTVLLMWSYHRSLLPGRNIEHARAMAMVVLSCASAADTALLSRLRTKSAWLMTSMTLIIAAVFVQDPWFAKHLALQPLHGDDWLIAVAGGLLSVATPMMLYSFVQRSGKSLVSLPERGKYKDFNYQKHG